MISRRQFVGGAAAVPFALRGVARADAGAPQWVLLGTDTGKGIYRARWDARKGEIGEPELAVETLRPVYLAKDPSLPVVYCTNEGDAKTSALSSFVVDAVRGSLMLSGSDSVAMNGPCYVSVDPMGELVFVANYAGGSFQCVYVDASGKPVSSIGIFGNGMAVDGHAVANGPNKERQDASHMHCATLSPDGRFVTVCDLGKDLLMVFEIHREGEAGGASGSAKSAVRAKPAVRLSNTMAARAGSGPRHVAFHPNGKWMYCIHELDCTIDLYDWNVVARHGKKSSEMVPMDFYPKPKDELVKLTLRGGSTISTLRPGVAVGENTACEVLVSDDGRFVYASTRGVDEIAVYRVDDTTGMLNEVQRVSCGGKVPRYMAFDPARRWLLSCNQAAPGSVTVFALDEKTGRLSEKPKVFAAETPMFCLWV